jgi:hypothetical protein
MSLLGAATLANEVKPYYSGGGGGGGGVVTSTSQLLVSSINTLVNGQAPTAPNGIDLPGGANLDFVAGGGGPDIQFTANNGTITGLSSVNGAPVRGISTPTTGGGYFGQTPAANLNPSVLVPLSTGRWYLNSLEITDMTFVSQPAATDCFNILFSDGVTQMNLGTFNMAQVSTNRGVVGDCGFSVCGPFEAQSTIGAFQYKANAGAPSTFITTSGKGWSLPLN